MDSSVIYSKTAKGVNELKSGGKSLPTLLLATLKRVDGRSSLAALCAGMTQREQEMVHQTMEALEAKQLIRVFARREEAPPVIDESIPFETDLIPTIRVEELGLEEGVEAWAEARRGTRELVQRGFYATAHLAPDGTVTQRRSALIVEDDPGISLLMKSFLTRKGFAVRIVADGEEALRLLDERPIPDIALLDVNLPNVNGFDILAYIRAHDELQKLPAVMVTAQVSDADVLRGLKGGADGYIFKPFQWNAFYECVKRVLGIQEQTLTVPARDG